MSTFPRESRSTCAGSRSSVTWERAATIRCRVPARRSCTSSPCRCGPGSTSGASPGVVEKKWRDVIKGIRTRGAQGARRLTLGPLPCGHGRGRLRFSARGDPEDLLRGLREFAEQQAEIGAGGAARAVRDADAEHGRRPDLGSAEAHGGRRRAGRAGDRAARRDARALSRGSRARERSAQGLHARDARLGAPDGAFRPRDRSLAAGGAAAGRPPHLVAVTSPGPSSPTRRRPSGAEQARQARDDRRARRGDHERGGDARDRERVRGGARRDRRARPRLEHQRQADCAGAGARLRPLREEPRGGSCGRARVRGKLRAHRHGGLDDDGRDARHLPRAA